MGESIVCFYEQSPEDRRLETDDIDASSRLPLLSNPYYRDALGDYGAFFALAYLIDSVHKNAWIGFQSWRVSARKVVHRLCLHFSLLMFLFC